MTETKQRVITEVLINFADNDFRIGIRGHYHTQILKLDEKMSETLRNRLVKKDGEIVKGCYPMQLPMPNTGILAYRNPDTYDGKDIKMVLAGYGWPAKLVQSHWARVPTFSLTDLAAFIIIKTYFEGETVPHIGVHRITKDLAKRRTDSGREAYSITIDNPYWQEVHITFNEPDGSYENSIHGNNFDYLVQRDGCGATFAESMSEPHFAFSAGGGGGGGSSEFDLDTIIKVDASVAAAKEHMKKNPRSTEEIAAFALKLTV